MIDRIRQSHTGFILLIIILITLITLIILIILIQIHHFQVDQIKNHFSSKGSQVTIDALRNSLQEAEASLFETVSIT